MSSIWFAFEHGLFKRCSTIDLATVTTVLSEPTASTYKPVHCTDLLQPSALAAKKYKLRIRSADQ